ncbi:MAG: zinc ribbon domain-containing protein [Bacilli bacterium]
MNNEIKYCQKCGNQLPNGCSFCPNCGTKNSTPGFEFFKQEFSGSNPQKESMREKGLVSLICGCISLIIPCFGLALSIVAWVVGKTYHKEEPFSKAGYIIGIVSTILQVLWIAVTILLIVLCALSIIQLPYIHY